MTKKSIDWPSAEQLYRDTKMPVAAIARANSCTSMAIKLHMDKLGIVRNPPQALDASSARLPAITRDNTAAELAGIRKQIIAGHAHYIALNHARLNAIAERLDANAKLTDKQRLDFLAIVVKVQATIVDMERKANSIVDAAPVAPPPVAIQVNIDLSPHDAYMQLIGKR
jgi:hypothetical protein